MESARARTGAPLGTRPPRSLVAAALAAAALGWSPTVGANALMELYRRALDHDATFAAALDERDAAVAGRPLARSAFRPQIAASAALGREWVDSARGDDDYGDGRWQLQLSQSVFDRTNAALVDQADVAAAQAGAELESAREALLLRVAGAYLDALRAEAGLAFGRSERRAIERQREQAERRFDVGLAPVTDVRTAQARADLAAAQEIAAGDALASAREALRVVAGVEIGPLDALAPDLPLLVPEPADIDAWVVRALEANRDLAVARLAAERAGTQVAVERGARWPSVDVVASGGAADTDQALREGEVRSARIGVQATLPLYTGGRTGARVAQARASLDAATDRLLGAERLAAQRARDGYRGVVAGIARVRALRRALASTESSAASVEAGFRNGTRTSIDVLTALRDVFRARSDFANARYDYVLSSLRLKAAAGALDETDLEAIDRFLVPAE